MAKRARWTRPGQLRYLVTLRQPVAGAADAYNQPSITWQDVAQVWAAVEPQTGREFWMANQVFSEMSHLVTIRYRSDVKSTWRVIWESKTLEILAVIDPEGRKRELQLVCKEKVQ